MNFPALDVALGLVFLYFIFSLVCSGINEAIASGFCWRAQDLERGLLLKDPKQGVEALEKLKEHPLIKPMLYPQKKYPPKGKTATAAAPVKAQDPLEPPKTNRKSDFPSYIPSRTFVSALLGLEQKALSVRKIDESIKQIPSEPVQEALTCCTTPKATPSPFGATPRSGTTTTWNACPAGTGGASKGSSGCSRSFWCSP